MQNLDKVGLDKQVRKQSTASSNSFLVTSFLWDCINADKILKNTGNRSDTLALEGTSISWAPTVSV